MANTPGAAVNASPPNEQSRASASWIFKLSLAYFGVNITWAGPGQVLMAPQIQWLTENTPLAFFTKSTEVNLSIIGTSAGILALISTPLWGALSDRTRSRWGKRTPWMALGMAILVVTLVITGFAWSLPALMVAWLANQAAINAVISPMSASIPDQVPSEQRGLVSGWYGFAYTLAVVVGTALGTAATAIWPSTTGIAMGYILVAIACLISMLPFLLDRWERDAPQPDREPFAVRDIVSIYWVDLKKNPDFGWAWLTRFTVTLSSAIALFYLYLFLQNAVGLRRDDVAGDGLRVSDGVLILTGVYALSVFLTVVTAGSWSVKIGRRRIFVLGSAMLYVVASLMMAFAPTFSVVVVAAVVLGLGTGIFTSVDFALVSEVLPSAEDNGKDIGIINLAIGLPNVLAPVVAAYAVTQLGGYTSLYLVSAALAAVGGVLVYRVRSVP